jgi:glycerol-3-phosphate O-acyltransferase / dihydroxyacetone phosphate acyltransferase
LVTFHPPLTFRPKVRRPSRPTLQVLTPVQDNPELLEPVNYDNIQLVTAQMRRLIANGTFDAPSWDLIRAAKMATPIYAPLGTAMSLGDYVRVTRTFLEAFKAGRLLPDPAPSTDSTDQNVSEQLKDEDIVKLKEDLQVKSTFHRHPNSFFFFPFLNQRPLAGIPGRTVSAADQR